MVPISEITSDHYIGNCFHGIQSKDPTVGNAMQRIQRKFGNGHAPILYRTWPARSKCWNFGTSRLRNPGSCHPKLDRMVYFFSQCSFQVGDLVLIGQGRQRPSGSLEPLISSSSPLLIIMIHYHLLYFFCCFFNIDPSIHCKYLQSYCCTNLSMLWRKCIY